MSRDTAWTRPSGVKIGLYRVVRASVRPFENNQAMVEECHILILMEKYLARIFSYASYHPLWRYAPLEKCIMKFYKQNISKSAQAVSFIRGQLKYNFKF